MDERRTGAGIGTRVEGWEETDQTKPEQTISAFAFAQLETTRM